MALRDGMLVALKKGFLNLEIEGNSKIVTNCYNKKTNIPNSIFLVMDDIWNSSHGLNIYVCRHYKETNRITDCLTKKWLDSLYSSVW